MQSEPTIGLADELNMAPLGIGAWAWGTTRLWGYGKEYDRSDVGEAFRASMVEGVTLVDTAEMYGNGASERIIGEILREGAFEATPVIATKFAPLPYRFSAKSLLSAVDKSLKRLGIETIDLYQIHFPNPIFKINALMDVLAETVKAGKVRRVEASRELGVTLIAYSPIAQGLLTGKYAPGDRPVGLVRRMGRAFGEQNLKKIEPVLNILREIGEATSEVREVAEGNVSRAHDVL